MEANFPFDMLVLVKLYQLEDILMLLAPLGQTDPSFSLEVVIRSWFQELSIINLHY